MKTLLYTLTLVTLLSSCRSIEKMVDKGEYDEAIEFATKKLAGKKKKKTKHVQGLEEAYNKINRRDLDQIAYLDGENHPENWEKIEAIYDRISERQEKIQPFLPLISKEGYEGYFPMLDAHALKRTARDNAAEYYYAEGKSLLFEAEESDDKYKARAAYDLLVRADRKVSRYKDTRQLLEKTHLLGIEDMLIEVKNNTRVYLPERLEAELLSINVQQLNSHWRRFHTDVAHVPSSEVDYKVLLELNEIEVSPERETIRHHTDEKRIKDGHRYLKDKKGKILRDTTGKKIKEDKYITVYADVSEIERSKAAYVSGFLKQIDLETDKVVHSEPLSVEVVFNDRASTFRGDRRAVCDKDHSYLKEHPVPFPHDEDMIADATHKLKANFARALEDIR